MERTQFTFYASFASALLRIKRKETRCAAYDAIVCYALYNQEPDLDSLPDAAAIAFELIRPTLDASRRKAENGKTGRSGKQSESKPEASQKQNESKSEAKRKQTVNEKEDEIEIENESELEDECPPPVSPSCEGEQAAALSRVFGRYMDCMPPPSPTARDLLCGYTHRLGPDAVIRAIDIAADERKLQWSYIHGILERYASEGLDSLEKIKAAEAEWRERRNKKPRGRGNELLDMIERGEFGD